MWWRWSGCSLACCACARRRDCCGWGRWRSTAPRCGLMRTRTGWRRSRRRRRRSSCCARRKPETAPKTHCPRRSKRACAGWCRSELADPARRAARFAPAAQQLAESPPVREQPEQRQSAAADAAAPRAPRRANKTDPESRMMLSPRGWIQGYNAQLALDESHLVLACDVSANPSDYRLLQPMITLTEQALAEAESDQRPGCYLADAGYWNGKLVEQLSSEGRRLLVKPNGRPRRRGRSRSPAVAAMERRLAHPANRRRFHRRQALAEPVIAQIKVGKRLDRFRLRGLAGARLEWTLACTAHNLRRLHRQQTATS